MAERVLGSLPAIIRNDEGVYEGNLRHYFPIIFGSSNVYRPYHNFRHMTHVLWLCHEACKFYKDELDLRQRRNLMIAGPFHDYNHPGIIGNDDLNIERSIRGLHEHLQEVDKPHFEDIATLIRATEYPPPKSLTSRELTLSEQIICDTDLSQALSVAWIQQVIFGLALEWNKTPLEVLKIQEPFLRALRFKTKWAETFFTQQAIADKIAEARELLELLTPPPAVRLAAAE